MKTTNNLTTNKATHPSGEVSEEAEVLSDAGREALATAVRLLQENLIDAMEDEDMEEADIYRQALWQLEGVAGLTDPDAKAAIANAQAILNDEYDKRGEIPTLEMHHAGHYS